MTALTLDELFEWTEEERAKWEAWFPKHPETLTLVLKGDRFGTVAGLIGHIFEAEQRQTHRLAGIAAPARNDPSGGTAPELFAAGRKSRTFLRETVAKFGPAEWTTVVEFDTSAGKLSVTKRKLALHLPLHEVRHWAQIARTVREHDIAPPGTHDLMFSDVLK